MRSESLRSISRPDDRPASSIESIRFTPALMHRPRMRENLAIATATSRSERYGTLCKARSIIVRPADERHVLRSVSTPTPIASRYNHQNV